MILPADEVLAGLPFVLRRFGLPTNEVRESTVRAALAEATVLAATDERSEPAAVFFASARRPRGLGGAWTRLAVLLAQHQARAIGVTLRTRNGELRSLCVRIAAGELSFDDVRAWFAARI